ncbi:sce7726 family protein [Clavibacter sepedonicus]|uniref:sce7726 family protein n=1 Tax=Clavibacter sepedonicus TaxID=31964 RepID=UPI00130534D2|nr:sce7726 family protein [Clavibacter sp.]
MGSPATPELAALSRLFSPAAIRELGRSGRSPLVARLLQDTSVPADLPGGATLRDALNLGYQKLTKSGNRDDYVYRSAVVEKIALGRHNLRTATVLSEVRARASKADLVILNDTATAYEIKSERDSLGRLASQLSDYRSVFASVTVVTSPRQADAVLRLAPDDVGVLALSPRLRLQVIRETRDLPERIDPTALLDTLRSSEAAQVLSRIGVETPDVPNTHLRAELRRIYAALDPVEVHRHAVTVLKQSRTRAAQEAHIGTLPPSIRTAALFGDLNDGGRANLSAATSTSMSSVMTWS